tara:strand:+ start:212 stop:1525 length:1314 start_codon:yes stop_codon:yes gene_type:complete
MDASEAATPRPVSPSLVLFPATKKRARSPVAPDEPADRRVDLTQGEGPGKLLGYNDWGEWRTVPGFDEEKLQVSDQGYYRVWFKGGWTASSKGYFRPDNRYHAGVNGLTYPVARLVCRAFHGPSPSRKHDADHIDRNTTNDNASNLRWATKQENNANRNLHAPHSDGLPIRIRKLDWPEEHDWEHFVRAETAANAYGLHACSLRAVAHTKAGTHNRHPVYQCKGFIAEWLPHAETQGNLLAGDDSNLLEPPSPEDASATEERWRMALDDPRLWVSDRGRVRTQHARGDGWGHRRTPQPTNGNVYAKVKYKGKSTYVHIVVYITFGRRLLKGETIDHKVPSRKFDNRFVHLRPATRREQSLNQNRKPPSEMNNSLKKAVWGRAKDAAEDVAWERFESSNEARRQLHARFLDKAFQNGNICNCANGKAPTAYGWVFCWA